MNLAMAFGIFVMTIAFAFAVNALVEAGLGKLLDILGVWMTNADLAQKIVKTVKIAQFIVAVAAGVKIAGFYSLDLFYAASLTIPGYAGEITATEIGIFLTGCTFGMGAAWIHDFWENIVMKKPIDPLPVK